ncbi:hypothetical protein COOONC_25220 [Cooperia oncophora]
MNIGSPASVSRAGLYPDQLKDVIGTLSSSVREPAALPQTTGADTKEPVRGEIPVQSSTASVAAAVPGDTTSSFAERLKARNEMKRTIKFPTMTAKEEPEKDNAAEPKAPPSSETDDVMGRYLALISAKPEEKEQSAPMSVVRPSENIAPESDFLDLEEVVIDKEPDFEDEIEW